MFLSELAGVELVSKFVSMSNTRWSTGADLELRDAGDRRGFVEIFENVTIKQCYDFRVHVLELVRSTLWISLNDVYQEGVYSWQENRSCTFDCPVIKHQNV